MKPANIRNLNKRNKFNKALLRDKRSVTKAEKELRRIKKEKRKLKERD